MSFGDETSGAFESRLLWGCLEKGGKIVFGLLLFLSGMKRPAKIREGGENLRPRSFCTQTSFAPKIIPRSIDVTACVRLREAQYSLTNKSSDNPPT